MECTWRHGRKQRPRIGGRNYSDHRLPPQPDDRHRHERMAADRWPVADCFVERMDAAIVNITIGEIPRRCPKTGDTFKQSADDWWATIDSSNALIEPRAGASVVAVTRQDAYSSTIAANTVTPSTS